MNQALAQWFAALSTREKLVLAGGGVISLVLILNYLLWKPLQSENKQIITQVDSGMKDLKWMRTATAEIKSLQGLSAKPVTRANQSLLGAINNTAGTVLKEPVTRIEERKRGTANLWFDKVSFDSLVIWLEKLDRTYGISVYSIVIRRLPEQGMVNVQLTLKQ
ncbi:MAG: hypothetical protein BMS9Abin26_1962 [Gammaproteobacteria bacterium]|nr:MAG: hypothetical protein BMS9Abin26_1962 [Gammaproteobacteria bacterium]